MHALAPHDANIYLVLPLDNRPYPMRNFVLFFLLVSAHVGVARNGQLADRIRNLKAAGARIEEIDLMQAIEENARLNARWEQATRKAGVLRPDPAAFSKARNSSAGLLALRFPFEGATMTVEVQRVDIAPGGLKVRSATGASMEDRGVHFRGMVKGMPHSWVAISLFDGEVMGLINDGNSTIVLGRFEDRRDDLHVIYRERDLRRSSAFQCGTQDEHEPYHQEQLAGDPGERTVRCVRYYWEVNHNVFQDKGSLAATTTYATGLFNQSAALFDNDGIDVVLSELFIWDVESPYTGPGSSNYLTQFGTYRTSFNGDLAHLIGYGGGGGVAWVNTICSGLTNLRMAYSGINSSFSNVPTYSWSVEVTTHEAGHNLGSSHTHACVWNGNGTSIDGCGPTAGYTEGSCATGPLPSGTGGTIMSYCHLVGGVGINFNNGFGPQPSAVIRNAVNAATCLGACGSTCDAPHNLNVSNLTTTAVTLTWANIGATSYDLRWRFVGAGAWNTVNGLTSTSQALSGLTPGANYEFQVSATCSTGTSGFSAVRTFTTPLPCPDALEPNNSLATAASITEPVTINALIATAADVDHYRFTTTGTRNIAINLSGLYADFDLRLLNSTGTILASSTYGGTSSEYINYQNAPAGTYYAYVFGYNGAFTADMCYTLFIRTTVSECLAPQELTATNITYNSADISWPGSNPTGGSYDLRWKQSSASTWTEVSGIAAAAYALGGLSPLTFYDVQVRKVCGGTVQGTTSAYSDTLTFSTAAAPCEVAPPIQLRVRLWLDGAYIAADQLMHDSLRLQGWLPFQEPYTAMGFNPQGSTSTTLPVLAISGPNAVVDWVLVELRSNAAPYAVVETHAALLQRDGDVVGVDGTSPVIFCSQGGEAYRVSVRHRNHFGCMTSSAVVLGSTPATVDFRTGSAHGTEPMRSRAGTYLLWAGNARADDLIRYSGEDNDRDVILQAIGGAVPTNTLVGYRREDVNLDGTVKYSGSNNDRDVILSTIGGAVPTNTVVEQLP